ncbi:MAG TPA: DUF3108 domain-containing protein [Candidatus Binatus sp.]|nr:DUF3108 domain-containing protein [Candidatus Binatus sp.]
MRKRFARDLFLMALTTVIAAALSLQRYALGSRFPQSVEAASKIALANPAAETPMPFGIGETLNYDVSWSAFSAAAKIQLCVTEHREILGSRTWHFRASAHTLSPLRSFLTVDDQIDSYTDTATFESRQYEMYLYEMGKKDNQILHFSVAGRPQKADVPVVVVSPGTLDPLGALYVLRQVHWQHTPEFRAPVFDGDDLVEMRAHLEAAKELVAVNAGNYSATRILVREYQHGVEVKGESLSICFANDAARTPILLEAEIPFGSVRIELSSLPH